MNELSTDAEKLTAATDALRVIAEMHCITEYGHLHSRGEPALQVVIGTLQQLGIAEIFEVLDRTSGLPEYVGVRMKAGYVPLIGKRAA